MKKTHKTKNITCRIVSKGTMMQVNTIDEILSPGQYKMDACGVTTSDGFPDGVDGECLSAYLEVSDTNHSADNLKSAAVGQTLTYTNADGDTAVYHRSGTNKDGKVEWSAWSDTAALGLQNGSITSEKLSSDIRKKIESPLRPLFIAAGAEYNDTGADKTKTAPWGEDVIHKAGHYYLNGLGDITEEQMIEIYNAGKIVSEKPTAQYSRINIRTTLKSSMNGSEASGISYYYLCNSNKNIETFCTTTSNQADINNLHATFIKCNNLTHIFPALNINAIVNISNLSKFTECYSLTYCKFMNLKVDCSFLDSPNIGKESILYIIQNASPSNAITITLHPQAYARLSDDNKIVAALDAQPLVSLVCA